MKTIKYLCQFHLPVENDEGRIFTLSSNDKASYIHDILVRLGFSVDIISATSTRKLCRSRIDYAGNNIRVISSFSLPRGNSVFNSLARISTMIWLLWYMVRYSRRGEAVFIYHGIQNIPVYLLLKKFKQLKYILEVEEVYSSLSSKNGWRSKMEEAMIERADAYIFASETLEKQCNKNNKPYAIAYGAYKVPSMYSEKRNDGKIHLVYAGLIKKDLVAFQSARIAKYLDSKYYIHIIGYGDQYDIDELKQEIEEIKKETDCSISYDGLKREKEYLSFLQSCHIGLCPLSNNKEFQKACFPSKITSYLSNGLIVITTDNEVLKKSAYKNYLCFVKDDTPMAFADVIKNVQINKGDNPRDCIASEDERTIVELKSIMESMLM